jgi:pilus assembly protein CpaF
LSIANKLTEARSSDGDELVGQLKYAQILEDTREWVIRHHREDLNAIIDDETAKEALHSHIFEYLINNVELPDDEDISLLEDRIFQNMAGITKFLRDLLSDPDVEDVGINAWNDIDVIYTSKGLVKSKEHFSSPEEALDIVKKMTRQGKHVVDGGKPIVDSYYKKGVRISALVPPVVDEDVGVVCSIRKQTQSNITRDQLLACGTATLEELEFIEDCVKYGVSLVFAGATGSGKTTSIQWAASTIPDTEYSRKNKRVYVIEETRELNLVRTDESGKTKNSVIHTQTRQSDDPNLEITENDLLRKALRHTPAYIIPAEMRGEEAYTALKSAQTGHTIITSLHAENARDTYYRMVCLCRENVEARTFSDKMLYRMIASAFPIIVFQHQLADGSRKIMEIIEAVGFEKEEIICNTLFSYEIMENVYDKNGTLIEIKGKNVKGKTISSKIEDKFRDNGAPDAVLKRYKEVN